MEIAGEMKFSEPSVMYSGKSRSEAEIIILIAMIRLHYHYNAKSESSGIQVDNQQWRFQSLIIMLDLLLSS
jgi:hypothetical protein